MADLINCPKCGSPVVKQVDLDDKDPNAEWVGYVCPNCTPMEGT